VSNDRGQGPPPKSPLGSTAGRPLRGPQASTNTQSHRAPEPRSPAPARSDDLAHLYRKIADLQADAAQAEARAVKAEREQSDADGMLGQMLARVSEVEARLRAEQKRSAEGEAALAQAAKLRGSQSDMLERLQMLEAQSERARIDLTQARREASTHRLAADDQLHLLAKEREETADLRARLEREQKDREALRARVAELDRAAGERNEATARARELLVEIETTRKDAAVRERELAAKLEQARVEIRRAHDSADALEDHLAEARDKLAAEHAAAEDARRELAAERAQAAESEADVARLELAREAGERAQIEARAELTRVRAAHEEALASLREAHTVELAEALSERSRRERSAVDAEISAGRRDLLQLEETLAEARRQIDLERAAAAEAQSLLAGEREWVAEMEEDSLRREEDLEKTRRALGRADAHARASEARRVELEDAFADAERALATQRGELEALRVEAAMHRMRIGELERERELRAGLIEVNAVPAEIERLRRRVASAEARAAQMHTELAGAIDEVTHLLTELERREVETARVRTQSLASARSLLEHVTAATRPVARPAIEAATSARAPEIVEAPPEPANQAVDIVDEITAERAPEPAAAAAPSVVPPPLPSVGPPPLPPELPLPFPAAPPIVGLPSLHDEDEEEATMVVQRESVRPLPLSS
jgi:chromosome segregation ATPase